MFSNLPQSNCIRNSYKHTAQSTKDIKNLYFLRCNELVNQELTAIAELVNNRRKRDTDEEDVVPTDEDYDTIQNYDYDNFTSRERRSSTSAVSFFAPLLSSFIPVIPTLYALYSAKRDNDIMRKSINDNTMAVSTLARAQLRLAAETQRKFCDSNFLTNNQMRGIIMKSEVRTYIDLIETEVLMLRMGRFPPRADIIKNLISICASIESNTVPFCRSVLLTSYENIQINFKGVSIFESNLNLVTEITFPLLSPVKVKSKNLIVRNVGGFSNETYFKIDLDQTYIQRQDGKLTYNLNMSLCKQRCCPINAISHLPSATCMQNILEGTTAGCLRIEKEAPDCYFERTGSGSYLIAARQGTFFPQAKMSKVSDLVNTTLHVNETGRLRCFHAESSEFTTHYLHATTSRHFDARDSVSVDFNLNTTILLDDVHDNLEDKILEIAARDDNMTLGDTRIHWGYIILLIHASLLLVLVIIYYMYRAWIKFTCPFVFKRRDVNSDHDSLDNHFGSPIINMLTRASESVRASFRRKNNRSETHNVYPSIPSIDTLRMDTPGTDHAARQINTTSFRENGCRTVPKNRP